MLFYSKFKIALMPRFLVLLISAIKYGLNLRHGDIATLDIAAQIVVADFLKP